MEDLIGETETSIEVHQDREGKIIQDLTFEQEMPIVLVVLGGALNSPPNFFEVDRWLPQGTNKSVLDVEKTGL